MRQVHMLILAGVCLLLCAVSGVRADVLLDYVADAEINRAVGYANMRDSLGIGFVPGDKFGVNEKDRVVLVNYNNFTNQRYISYWQIDSVSPGSLGLTEAQTVLANNGTATFDSNRGVSFVDDPTNPHLLLGTRYWGFSSQVATIDVDLDMTTYNEISLARAGGGDEVSAVAWDPTHDNGVNRSFIYDCSQGGKLMLHKEYTGGYPPTGTTNDTGYSDPPQITGVVNGRTYSATTGTFFSAVGTTVYETATDGTYLGEQDLANLLPGPEGNAKTITGLANDDERGYIWAFSRDTDASKGYVVAFEPAAAGLIPEPAGLSLLGLALLGLKRRRS